MYYSIQDFIKTIAKLRDPNDGCPWDLKQNYQTMIPYLLEESYEVVEAIRKNNYGELKEELGDLLLQVVFLSQLASEDNIFNFEDVVHNINEKIIRRHPHVFGTNKANNEIEALENWNTVKSQENKQKGYTSILDNIPFAFPALTRAEKLQKRCSKIGFDWNDIKDVFAKVEEELEEVKEELKQPEKVQNKIEEEIGDLLFSVVNLSRHLKCDPEESLRKANIKFENRFRKIEKKLQNSGKSFEETSLVEMDLLWDEVKKEKF
ncbi:ATP diphosphatase [Bisgaardia hudsonensis]|uniref:Nucleoside triphosphate pyrophosphohydrolase n=1 Tax=Bisgaardia hudsonensis TaxID=109472 RepID=A0A4R2MX94_9PAST|nr:nucleoside triphosphate pyrophosphohydrolase [Bisgaardia hudsonensis]QLB13839.1 nucleoside triphosphate pyrophosphohydrolase [Bisgaardia hudsonensis]TCP11676.1 ATP diphosphatase [Bisgaardia hudsonensis]